MICPVCGGRQGGLVCGTCGGTGVILDRQIGEKFSMQIEQSRIPDFLQSLDKMREVHIKKNQDYAADDNPFSNFDAQEDLIVQFKKDRDKVFACMVAVKLARLATLLNSDREPNHESIDDSFIDAANYILLWKADRSQRKGISVIPNTLIK